VKCDIETFLTRGSPQKNIWFILFKTPGCQYCEQAEILFFNTYIEYNRKFYEEVNVAEKTLERGIKFVSVDWYLNHYSATKARPFATDSMSLTTLTSTSSTNKETHAITRAGCSLTKCWNIFKPDEKATNTKNAKIWER
jgi:predicted adenine nucleotide alpha hydrolase (AANH) superfamily ATPase